MPNYKACITFEFQLCCLLLILRYGWYVSISWILPWTCWFGVMNGSVSQQDPTQEPFHLKNSYWSTVALQCRIVFCCTAKWISHTYPAVCNLFGFRDPFCGRQFFHHWRWGGWFQDDSSVLLLLWTLFLFLLHQLHLRSPGLRSQRLGPLHTYVQSFFGFPSH